MPKAQTTAPTPKAKAGSKASSAAPSKAVPRVGIVSLGCPKALVDSERILTRLRAEGYEISGSYEGADVVLVNTCGFLDSAKKESLDAIGEALRENGKVIVTGCMGVEESRIREIHPGVLSVTGPQQYEAVVEAVHQAVPPRHDPFVDLVPPQGIKLTPRHYAYLKISEGCNHRCSFCIIPSMRGDLVSRPAAEILYEAERLVVAGVKELLVISQDTSAYGIDIRYAESLFARKKIKARMTELCAALGEFGAWVRLHYVYPYPHVDELMPLMAEKKILPYLDIPFQHASPSVLKAMKRPANDQRVLDRIQRWRKEVPCVRPSSSASPARRKRISTICCSGWRRRISIASAVSSTSRSKGPPPTRCPAPYPTRSRRNAGIASCRRSRRSAPGAWRRRSAAGSKSSSTKSRPAAPFAGRMPMPRKSTATSSCAAPLRCGRAIS